MPVTTRSTVSDIQTNAGHQRRLLMHETAARKVRIALLRLAEIGLDYKVTLSVRINHDGVSVHAQVPMSDAEDAD